MELFLQLLIAAGANGQAAPVAPYTEPTKTVRHERLESRRLVKQDAHLFFGIKPVTVDNPNRGLGVKLS